MKKYELTDELINVAGRTLSRIKALKSFSNIKKGDLGGFVQSEVNLSHSGGSWVADNAKVFDNARVYGNAVASEYATVFDNTKIHGYSQLSKNVQVAGSTKIYGNKNSKVSLTM